MIYVPLEDLSAQERLKHMETVMTLLQTAEHHAVFAGKATAASSQEQDYLHFLRLVYHNVEAVYAMVTQQSHLEAEESFLHHFLLASPEDSALPAIHYRRRAEDILQGLWHILRRANKPYRELQDKNLDVLSNEEKERYLRAFESFHQDIIQQYGDTSAAMS